MIQNIVEREVIIAVYLAGNTSHINLETISGIRMDNSKQLFIQMKNVTVFIDEKPSNLGENDL